MHNILVVDDDKDILGVIKILLTMNDFSVTAISKGEDTYANLTEPRPDVILLDINLGRIDGRDICRILKERNDTKDIPIVMFSANHNMRENMVSCQANDFIEKPFDVDHLVDTLKALCN
jgi:DNA-binding response OmpR family regulator